MDVQLKNILLKIGDFELSADCFLPGGKSYALIGPSGEGKTTALLAIAGFVRPTAGQIIIGSQDCTTLRPADRPVTMLFQENNLFPHLTAFANAALGTSANRRLNDAQRRQTLAVLDRVGLSKLEDRFPGELSGGQRQRVALARSLLRDRPVLLLDEPFAALGPGLRAEMLSLVESVQAERRMTLIFVTHDPADALQIAGSSLFVSGGRIHPPAPTAGFFADPPAELKAYLGDFWLRRTSLPVDIGH